MTTRRSFLKSTAGSAVIVGCSPFMNFPQAFLSAAHRSDNDDNILVVIQLSGGNDGLNTVIPYADDEYYKNRLTLGIGKNAVLKVNDHIGLHPSMGGMSELMETGEMTIVQGVGYPQPNRSHFESMDLWHTAHVPAEQSIREGWIGKAISGRPADDIPAVHFGAEDQPLALVNRTTQFPSIRSLESFRFEANQDADLKRLLSKLNARKPESTNDLLTFVHSATQAAVKTSEQVEKILDASKTSTKYPTFPLAQKLQNIAKMIGAGLKTSVFYVTLDGFDTHSRQAESHAGLLTQLSQSVSAFVADLKEQKNMDRVSILTFSEFGRRVKENASQGTDHGAAAPTFLVGGKLKSGIVGDHPSLTDLGDGDLKFKIDYRSIYASLLEDWLQVKSKPVLGQRFKKLELFS